MVFKVNSKSPVRYSSAEKKISADIINHERWVKISIVTNIVVFKPIEKKGIEKKRL